MREMILQKIVKKYPSIEKAFTYYSIISVLNDLSLQRRELELLAFVGVRGTITPHSAREEFCSIFGTTLKMLAMLRSKLIRKGLLVMDGNMCKVNPAISLNFSKPIVLNITLDTDEDREFHKRNSKDAESGRTDGGEGDKAPMEDSQSRTKD